MDPEDPEDRSASEAVAFGLFKWEVYHKVLQRIFQTLQLPSQEGEAVKCGDGIHHVFFPGIIIHSLDGEEAWYSCAAWGAGADHPCPRCLVHKSQLHEVTKEFPLRTVKTMRRAYKQAVAAQTKAATEVILKANGLHKVEVCMSI